MREMKVRILLLLTTCSSLCCKAALGETWSFSSPSFWTRTEGGARLEAGADGLPVVRVSRRVEWALNGFPVVDVVAGDVFEIAASTRRLGPPPDEYRYGMNVCAVLTDSEGKVRNWTYAKHRLEPGDSLKARFEVPPGIVKVRVGFTGSEPVDFAVVGAELKRIQRRGAAKVPSSKCSISSGNLEISVDPQSAELSVFDRRTSRKWLPQTGNLQSLAVEKIRQSQSRIELECRILESDSRCRVAVAAGSAEEFSVVISGKGEMKIPLAYPSPFAAVAGDRIVVPMNEGMGFPVEAVHAGLWDRYRFYCGAELPMAFFGVDEDKTGAGWCAIVETPDDAAIRFPRSSRDGCYSIALEWDAQKANFGGDRRVRYVFRDGGGHVAMAKRYRRHIISRGKFVTLAEKSRRRPAVSRLPGAVNVWCWENPVEMVKTMRESGIDRILWSGGGSAEAVKALAQMPDVLVGRYDIYQDIFRPAQMAKLGKPGQVGNNGDAWPDDVAWTGASPDDWRRAWSVKAKDGSWTYCAAMCDSRIVPRLRRRIDKDLEEKPFNTRFLDVVAAGTWMECWNPAHPMTRSDSRRWRHELLKTVGAYNLVVGSETGHGAFVDVCDYFEGMLSIDRFRVPEAGRYIEKIWTEVPKNVAKYQVGPEYRLPLWELVYHECACAHWYWGDYSNKLPALWRKRDLFNVLYGTMPMFMFNRGIWERERERFVASYARTSPVARATGMSEMLSHRVLSEDRLVQATRFADGTIVVVNFGSEPYRLPDGTVVGPEDSFARISCQTSKGNK
jgi:hypothetical protein